MTSSLCALSANLPYNGAGILWKLDLSVQGDIGHELFLLCFKSKKYEPTSGNFLIAVFAVSNNRTFTTLTAVHFYCQ